MGERSRKEADICEPFNAYALETFAGLDMMIPCPYSRSDLRLKQAPLVSNLGNVEAYFVWSLDRSVGSVVEVKARVCRSSRVAS